MPGFLHTNRYNFLLDESSVQILRQQAEKICFIHKMYMNSLRDKSSLREQHTDKHNQIKSDSGFLNQFTFRIRSVQQLWCGVLLLVAEDKQSSKNTKVLKKKKKERLEINHNKSQQTCVCSFQLRRVVQDPRAVVISKCCSGFKQLSRKILKYKKTHKRSKSAFTNIAMFTVQ